MRVKNKKSCKKSCKKVVKFYSTYINRGRGVNMKQKIIYKEKQKTYTYSIKVNDGEREMLRYLKSIDVNFSKMVKLLLLETYKEVKE